jgi:hypothetical protein
MTNDEKQVLNLLSRWVDPGTLADIRARVEGRGHEEYGGLDLFTDQRNWMLEALEEGYDMLFYLGCEIMTRRSYPGQGESVILEIITQFLAVVLRQVRELRSWGR